MKMNKEVVLSMLLSLAIHSVILIPIFCWSHDENTITIKVDTGGSMNEKDKENNNPSCADCPYDPTEHDEPHEKLIDKVFCYAKKVVKAGFGLFLLVKAFSKLLTSTFNKK